MRSLPTVVDGGHRGHCSTRDAPLAPGCTPAGPPAFTAQQPGRLVGLVDGLRLGANVLTVRAPDGSTSRLTITDSPVGGSIISGEQAQPWLCTTDTNGLGKPTDAQCDAPSKVEFFYKSTDPSKSGLQSYDPANPPSDVATTTTDQGKTVPYVVRRERGALNRGI